MGVKLYFWAAFVLALAALLLNVGLFMVVTAIVLLPLLFVHVLNGIRVSSSPRNNLLLVLAATNLLLFALVRIDGVHVTNGSGLSALLGLVDVHAGYFRAYKNYHLIASIALLLLQMVLEGLLLNRKTQLLHHSARAHASRQVSTKNK